MTVPSDFPLDCSVQDGTHPPSKSGPVFMQSSKMVVRVDTSVYTSHLCAKYVSCTVIESSRPVGYGAPRLAWTFLFGMVFFFKKRRTYIQLLPVFLSHRPLCRFFFRFLSLRPSAQMPALTSSSCTCTQGVYAVCCTSPTAGSRLLSSLVSLLYLC